MANKYVSLEGGLDLETPPIEARPGAALEALNFYENVKGGYTSALGYERFDGQDKPSFQSYYYVYLTEYDQRGAVSDDIGDTVTISGLTFDVIDKEVNTDGTEAILIGGDWSGTPPAAGDLPITYGTAATVVSVVSNGYGHNSWEEGGFSAWLTAAQDLQRQRIGAVPGEGPVLGVAQNRDDKFAWRRSTLYLNMYRATASGWEPIDLAFIYEVDVTAATVASIGDVCGNETVVDVEDWLDSNLQPDVNKRVYIVKRTNTGAAHPASFTRDSDAANLGSVIQNNPWLPLANDTSNIDYINHNFYAGLSTYDMYFADGVNTAMCWLSEFDVVRPIGSNYRVLDEVCTHVFAHNQRLFVSTPGGTYLISEPGIPTGFDGVLGAQEIGVGDDISGFASTATDRLAIFTRNKTFGLVGTDPSNWRLDPISDNSGAYDGCLAYTDDVFASDDRGIARLSRTDKLGGFDAATATDDVQDLFNTMSGGATCATQIRKLNQMRFYYGNRFLFLSRVPFNANGNEGIRYGITEGVYSVPVRCVSTEEDTNGNERTFFGSDDGFVYEADSGTSADGADMEFLLSFHYNHMGTPLEVKRFVGVDFEAMVKAPVAFQMFYYMNDGQKSFQPRAVGFNGGEPYQWDRALFDRAVFDAIPLTRPRLKLRGSGYNIQFSFYRASSHEPQATLTGYAIRVKPRREVSI